MDFAKSSKIVLLIVGFISGALSIGDPENYVTVKNQAETLEIKFTGSVPDFSQLHKPPFGPLSDQLHYDICTKGVYCFYIEKNYTGSDYACKGHSYDWCRTDSLRSYNSLYLLGNGTTGIVHLYEQTKNWGIPSSFTSDQPEVKLANTSSIVVVGPAGVNATFYSLPNYEGDSACVPLWPGTIYEPVYNTMEEFGFSTIRSFKWGCHSKKIVQQYMYHRFDITPEISQSLKKFYTKKFNS